MICNNNSTVHNRNDVNHRRRRDHHHYPSFRNYWSVRSVLLVTVIMTVFVLDYYCAMASFVPMEGRYAFSLTTFDPSGKLGQVEHAMYAASLGPPLIAVCVKNIGVILVSIYSLPSPFIASDGTSRYVQLPTNKDRTVVVAHSGIQADGRVVASASQKICIEYEYTLDESIPMDILLEELALIFQSYTMKPGSRPFGCELLLTHIPSETVSAGIQLFRIDPSGCVQPIVDGIEVLGKCGQKNIRQKLISSNCTNASSLKEAEEIIIDILKTDLEKEQTIKNNHETVEPPKLSFLVGHVTKKNGLSNKII